MQTPLNQKFILLNTTLVLIAILFSQHTWANPKRGLEAHLRTGMVSGDFIGSTSAGTLQGDFSTAMSVDAELEYFTHSRKSILTRATMAMDSASGAMKYIYMGVGQRFFLSSRGSTVTNRADSTQITITPSTRFFISWDFGIAQIQILKSTESLSVQSNQAEYGISGGMGKKLGKDFNLEAQLGYSRGIPISSVAVDSTIMKMLVGFSTSF